MARAHQYRNALLAADSWTEVWNDDQVRVGGLSLTTLAEHLQVGMSSIILDDPDADLGHDGETILGHHRFELIESDATDDEHIVITFIGERKFRRGDTERPSLRVGAQRQIELSLLDLNCIPSFVIIDPDDPDAKRPAETVDDRLAWLLASDYLLGRVHDDGVVESSSVMMDAVPEGYGGQTAANVIGDCELAAGFGWNAWIYYLEDAGHYSLGFINANTSTLYSSDLRISNLLSDADTTTVTSFETGTTFLPLYDSELTKDPTNLVSGVHMPYRDNHVFRERQATKDIYGPREQSAPNSNIKTRTRARAMADDFLFQHRNDADNIHVAIEVPTSKANAIKAGQRLQVKFTHLPGYEGFTWCRVIRRTIIQEQATDRYIIDMDLSPQEPGCSGDAAVVQWAYDDSTGVTGPLLDTWRFSLDAPSTSGNLLVLAFFEDSLLVDDATMPAGWSSAIFNEPMDGTLHHCSIIYKVSQGEQSVDIIFDDTNVGQPRFAFLEIEGLTNASLYAAATINKQDPGPGYAIVPATSYPSGPMALLTICYMHGPENPDVLVATGTDHSLLIPWDVAWDSAGSSSAGGALINYGIGVGGLLHDTSGTSGTTPLYPAAGGWRFTFTNSHPTMTVGVVFVGDNCV